MLLSLSKSGLLSLCYIYEPNDGNNWAYTAKIVNEYLIFISAFLLSSS